MEQMVLIPTTPEVYAATKDLLSLLVLVSLAVVGLQLVQWPASQTSHTKILQTSSQPSTKASCQEETIP